MSCSACSSHVEKAVNKLENVEKASVNLLTETMDVTYDETKITSTEIINAVVKAGYGASAFPGMREVQEGPQPMVNRSCSRSWMQTQEP